MEGTNPSTQGAKPGRKGNQKTQSQEASQPLTRGELTNEINKILHATLPEMLAATLPDMLAQSMEAFRKGEEDRRVGEEAERRRKTEEDRRVTEEGERRRKLEEDRRATEEGERRRKLEEDRRATEEAERRRKNEEDTRATEEAERRRKTEEDRRVAEEAERRDNVNQGGGCTYKTFLSCKPNEFHGANDPVIVTNWIREMDDIFEISDCSNGQKVKYATHMLKGEASHWWHMVKVSRGNEAIMMMTWEEFTQLMMDNFCPQGHIDKLEEEFMKLQQWDTTVQEYTAKFTEKARFAPYQVATEVRKVKAMYLGFKGRN